MNYKLNFILVAIFLVISFYFTSIQFLRYTADEDVSVVTFKQLQFDSLSEDQYPPYTICFIGLQGKMYSKDSISWNTSLATPKLYYSYLAGSPRLPKMMGKNSIKRANVIFSKINFEDLISTLFYRAVSRFHIYGATKVFGCRSQSLWDCEIPWFQVTYQTERMVCYTRKFFRDVESTIRFEKMILNVSELIKMDVSVNIYVHKRGNLVEHLANNWAIKNLVDSKFRQFYSFNGVQFRKQLGPRLKPKNATSFDQTAVYTISNVIVMRYRNKRVSKCDPMEINGDEMWRAGIMDRFNCTPTYWNTFIKNSSALSKFHSCSYKDYRNLSQYINGLESFPRQYQIWYQKVIKSCAEMKRKVFVDSKDIIYNNDRNVSYLSLMFRYDEDYYMRVENAKGFDEESLLSQVGGFIGNMFSVMVYSVAR